MTDTTNIYPAAYPGPAFGISDVFSSAWHLFREHFPVFAGLAVVCNLPPVVVAFLTNAGRHAEESRSAFSGLATVGSVTVGLLFLPLLWASVTRAAFDAIQGATVHLRSALADGFGRLLTVVGVIVLTVLAIFGGFVMLVIPGILLMTSLYVSVPVAVLERRGMMESLHRSRTLSQGARFQIFGVIFITGMVTISAPPDPGSSTTSAVLYVILAQLQVFAFTFTAILQTVIWHRLRQAQDRAERG